MPCRARKAACAGVGFKPERCRAGRAVLVLGSRSCRAGACPCSSRCSSACDAAGTVPKNVQYPKMYCMRRIRFDNFITLPRQSHRSATRCCEVPGRSPPTPGSIAAALQYGGWSGGKIFFPAKVLASQERAVSPEQGPGPFDSGIELQADRPAVKRVFYPPLHPGRLFARRRFVMNPDREESARLEALYIRLRRTLRHTYTSASTDDIADAVQYAMNRYCTHVPEHVKASPPALYCWLYTISRRTLALELTRRKRYCFDLLAGGLETFPSTDDSSLLACTSTVAHLLTWLSPRSARAVWMHDVERWKPSEIATHLGCSINAVNHRVKRGRQMLRRMLRHDIGLSCLLLLLCIS